MYQIDAFKGPYFHEEFLKIYTFLLYELGGMGLAYGVGLYACIYGVLACAREVTSTHMKTAMCVGSIPGYGSWVIVMIVNL